MGDSLSPKDGEVHLTDLYQEVQHNALSALRAIVDGDIATKNSYYLFPTLPTSAVYQDITPFLYKWLIGNANKVSTEKMPYGTLLRNRYPHGLQLLLHT